MKRLSAFGWMPAKYLSPACGAVDFLVSKFLADEKKAGRISAVRNVGEGRVFAHSPLLFV
jgi:hypothetical protein